MKTMFAVLLCALAVSGIAETTGTKTENTSATVARKSEAGETVYVTKTGRKYHKQSCSYCKSGTAMDKAAAVAAGYTACSRCFK